MIVAFVRVQPHDPRFLEKVPVDVGASNLACTTELNSNELSESRGVVVSDSLGITEGFEDRIGSQDLFGEVGKVFRAGLCSWSVRVCNCRQVLDNLLGVLSLSCSRLSASLR